MDGVISNTQRTAISNISGHSSRVTKDYYVRMERKEDVKNSNVAFASFGGVHEDSVLNENEPSRLNVVDNEDQESSWIEGSFDDSLFDNEFLVTPEPACIKSVNGYGVKRSSSETQLNHDFEFRHAIDFSLNQVDGKEVYNTSLNMQGGAIGANHPEKNFQAKKAMWTDEEVDIVGNWCVETLKKRPEWAGCIISKCNNYIMQDKNIRQLFHPLHVASSARLRYGYDKYRMKHNIPI